MRPLVIHAEAGLPPRCLEDLSVLGGPPADRDALIAAGQALTWRATFTTGSLTAIPISGASALILRPVREPGQECWNDRFARGLAHRLAGELTIASVTARLLGEAATDAAAEEADLLTSAVDGLARLLDDLEESRTPQETAGRIVADTVRTHQALLGRITEQEVSVRRHGVFDVHSVRSVAEHLTRADLERVRARIGLPWPARAGDQVGQELGLARWRRAMQLRGHQMWCRLDGDDALVTDLWLRTRPDPPE